MKNKTQLLGISIAMAAAITITGCSDSSTTPSTAANNTDTIRLADTSESTIVNTESEASNLSTYVDDVESASLTWSECGDSNSSLPAAKEGQYSVNLIFAVVDEECAPLSSTFDIELHTFDLFADEYTSNTTAVNKWLDVSLSDENSVVLEFSKEDIEKTQTQSGADNSIGYFFDVTVNTENDDQKLCVIDFNTSKSEADTQAVYIVYLSKSTTESCPTQTYIDDVDDVETGECLSVDEDGICTNTNIIEPQEGDLLPASSGKADIQICTLNSADEVTCEISTFDISETSTDAPLSCFGSGYIEALEAGEDTTPYILNPEECV